MRILHIAPDEKFIDFAQDVFEEAWPDSNRFVIPGEKTNPFTYIKNLNRVKVGGTRYFYFGGLKQDLIWCDILVIHYLTKWAAYAAIQAHPRVKVVWSGWGADYYRLIPELHEKSILSGTAKLVSNDVVVTKGKPAMPTKDWLLSIFNDFVLNKAEIKCIPRIDYFSSPIPEDFVQLKNNLPDFRATFIQLNYASVERTINRGFPAVNGEDILIGNSAAVTNNHFEVFETLNKIDLSGRRLIVPLSYGDEAYRKRLISIGEKMFGQQFSPITDILPLESYNNLVSRCSIVIMNHCRQQALGNILTALYKGARVFLRSESPIYEFLTKKGAFVDTVESIISMDQFIFVPLTSQQKATNRLVIEKYWAHQVVVHNARQLDKCVTYS